MKKTLILACLALSLPVLAGAPPRPITVMTRNVFPGLDDASGVVAAVLGGDPVAIMSEVELVWQQVVASDFPLRSSALADEIAAARPSLLGLQEAALWRSQHPADFSPVPNARRVEYDFVEILLSDLRARGLRYQVVAESRNLDLELPRLNLDGNGNPDPVDVRWTDRDVLLALSEGPGAVTVLGADDGRFSAAVDLGGGLAIPRGWVSADVKVRGVSLRVVSTHLEDIDPSVQLAQAEELLSGPGETGLPAIFLGDFNSDANAAAGTYALLTGAGLEDAWSAVHPGDPGPTCCQDPLLTNTESLLDQRIDLVLFRGPFQVVEASRAGADPADRIAGLWPSDHAGVVVSLLAGR